jgi:uncharacterized damage-inducible protein DinB
MKPAGTEGERIAVEIGQALNGDAWHGPSLREVLDGVTLEEAMQRPIPTAHNIWELVLHITSWANITRRRITGGQAEPYENEDWPHPEAFTEENWSRARSEVIESHEKLCDSIRLLNNTDLQRSVPQGTRTIENMLHGLAQHDAYHGGQIAILKKAIVRNYRRSAL